MKEQKKPIRESEFLDADQLEARPVIADITTRVLLDAERLHRCVLCRSEQPDDVRWPRYALELQHIATGQSEEDVEYTCCPSCEPRLDKMLFEAEVPTS